MRLVIVGGVAGGASAATRARRLSESASITVFERDDYVSFANCGLPYYVGGEIEKRGKLLLVTPARFEKRFGIRVLVRHEVIAIDREKKTVRVHDRQDDREFDEPYDKLILAPGARPIVPETLGPLPDNVFVLRNIADVDRIKGAVRGPAALAPARPDEPVRAVVVGSGFIGLEMVEQLRRLGLGVVLVELVDQVLPPCDPELAGVLQSELVGQGVEVRLSDGLKELHATEGKVTEVELASGTRLDAQLVILGMGVKPNTELAVQAGLPLGESGGVQVGSNHQTADPDIYAVGDAAEYVYGPTGKTMRVALAGPANRSGRIAGEHAVTGKCSVPMAPVLATSIVRVFDKTLAMTGLSDKLARKLGQPAASVVIDAGDHAGYYPGAQYMWLKLTYEPESGKVLGAQAVGAAGVDKRIDVVATALRFGGSVRELCGLDLAYAPPFSSARDPVHVAAFVACNQLDRLVELVPPDADLEQAQVIDVRTTREVEKRPVPAAPHSLHIPLDELRDRLTELDPNRLTVTVCATGMRSYLAARILMQSGFSDVKNLTGGVILRGYAVRDS